MPTERLMLLDGYGLVYRGYFALPPLTTSKGELVNGVFGFASIVLRGIQDLQPEYLAVSFDLPGPTFRHEQYADYKATRVKMPDDLRDQFPKVREVVKALRIPVYEMPGYEADDVIGTITSQLDDRPDLETTIVTVDLDMLQLVTPRVRLMTTRSGVENTVIYDVAKIDERFGLRPDQMIDYKALKGDPTDNIPGVPGVGEKTAAKLIREFGDLDSVFERLDEVTPEKLREKLRDHRDQVFMGRDLSTIVRDLPVQIDLEAARLGDYDRDTVVRLFREYEFRTLIERLPPMAGETAEQRTERLRSVAQSGYVPAARVAGRPEGWGPGRGSDRPTSDRTPASPRLRRRRRAIGRRRATRVRRSAPTVRADGRPARRRSLPRSSIRDASRSCLQPPSPELEPWLIAQPAVGVALVQDDPRPRRGTPLAFAIVGTDGRAVAAEGQEASDAHPPHARTAPHPRRRARGQAGPGGWPRRRSCAGPDPGRVRHADRRLHPERGAAQPDDRGCRRRAPRPDPATWQRAARDSAGWPRSALGASGPRPAAAAADRDRRSGPSLPRGRAPAHPGPRADGSDRRGAR